MHALILQVDGRAYGGQAASQPQDFTRLGEMQSAFSGTAPLHHAHDSSDIGDFSATVLALIEANPQAVAVALRPNGGVASGVDGLYADSGIVSFRGHQHTASDITDFAAAWQAQFEENDSPAVVDLRANGGLLSGVDGLYADSGIVSFRGHQHQTADLVDFAGALAAQLGNEIFDSQSVQWNRTGSGVQPLLRRKPSGGLLVDDSGVSVDLGAGHAQAAYGDHTHAQLHNPVTFESSSSLAITLAAQDISLEVLLAPLSGLLITPSGLALDFGSGHNQVMRGDGTTSPGASLAVVSTNSLVLGLDTGTYTLSGSVRLNANPSFGRGVIGQDSGGLWVQLGSDAQSAAAGNHIHANADSGTNGFLSAADYRALHTLLDTGGLLVSADIDESLFFHDDVFFDSGTGIFVNGQKVVGDRVPAPAALTINLGGTIADALAAIPDPQSITFGDPSGVQELVADLTTNILPALRNALASIAAKDNQLITAARNFGWMG